MRTPEGKIKDKVRRILKAHNAYIFMPVQSGIGARTLDFLCCHHGWFIAIETKAPGKNMAPLQQHIGKVITEAGGITLLVNDDESLRGLEALLRNIARRPASLSFL